MIQKVFFNKTTKALIEKARNWLYKKDNVFVNIYNELEDKTFLSEKVPLNTPFVKKNKTLFVRRYIALMDLFRQYKLT